MDEDVGAECAIVRIVDSIATRRSAFRAVSLESRTHSMILRT